MGTNCWISLGLGSLFRKDRKANIYALRSPGLIPGFLLMSSSESRIAETSLIKASLSHQGLTFLGRLVLLEDVSGHGVSDVGHPREHGRTKGDAVHGLIAPGHGEIVQGQFKSFMAEVFIVDKLFSSLCFYFDVQNSRKFLRKKFKN